MANTNGETTTWHIEFDIDIDSNLDKEQIVPWINHLLGADGRLSENHPLADREIQAKRSSVHATKRGPKGTFSL